MGHHGAIVPYSTSVKALLLNTLEVVIFGEKSCNETTLTTLRLVDAPLLRVVRIGGNSFCYAGSFVVKKLPALEAVVVGEWCFAKRGNGTSLTIQDCPALTEVCVGSHAMEEWKKCAIEACPSLATLTVEGSCFQKASALRLEGLGCVGCGA